MSVSPLHAPAVESTDPLDALYKPNCTLLPVDSKGKPQKYIRTVMLVDGEYVTARIKVETGEIKPYKYKKDKKDDKPKARPSQATIDARATQAFSGSGDLLGYVPHWATIAPPDRSVTHPEDAKQGAMRKSKPNPNRWLLEDFLYVTDAIQEYACLDDMFVGCANLDAGGNSRPMNTGHLFSMLRDLNEINVETIQAYTGCSERHSYRLSSYLRILSTEFDKAVADGRIK